MAEMDMAPMRSNAAARDPLTALLERQSTSGMWEEPGRSPIELTVLALLTLLRLGITSSHPVHGAQTKKAVSALLEAIEAAPSLDTRLAELALGTLWLLSTGRRTRLAIKDAATRRSDVGGLVVLLGHDDVDLRAHVERIATV
jgi:Ca-activated chloride channel homolog